MEKYNPLFGSSKVVLEDLESLLEKTKDSHDRTIVREAITQITHLDKIADSYLKKLTSLGSPYYNGSE